MAYTPSSNYLTVRRLWDILSSFKTKIATALGSKSDKSSTVSNVAWSSSKLTKTINGTTTDVVSASTLKSAMSLNNVTNDAQVKRSEMGTASGVATLDANGIINTSQLPSYVDDVLEYSAKSQFPATGETGKIYVDTSTNLTWRWSGTTYVEISPSLALGETSSTAYRGDRGKTAYDHSQLTSGNPHNVTAADVKAVRYDTNAQNLTDTQKSNARTNIGAGTSNLTIGTTSSTASAGNHSHGNIANGGTLADTAAAAAGNDYVVIRDADNAKIQTSTIKGTDVADAVSKKHSHSTLTLSTTAQAYDGTHTLALPASDPYTSARTPASHTHGNIQNGGTLQTTDVAIASGDKLIVTDASDSNKIARTSVSFDGSTAGQLLTKAGTFANPKEAFLDWGGRNLSSSYGPLDAALVSVLGANRFSFAKPAGITIEYTRDGGTTWIDYGASDNAKRELVTATSGVSSFTIGKADANNKATAPGNWANYKLKITFTNPAFGLYTNIRKIPLLISTNGSAGTQVSIRVITRTNEEAGGAWSSMGSMTIGGWSGWNIFNLPSSYTPWSGSSTQKSQHSKIEFLFEATQASSESSQQYVGLQIIRLFGYGSSPAWSKPSVLADTGNLYSFDNQQNATFPAKVIATSFDGKLTTARKLAVSLSNTSTDTSFDGSADVTNIKTSGTLGVGNGGTGKTTVTAGNYLVGNGTSALTEKTPNVAANDLINALTTGEATPTGDDYYVAQFAGGGTTTKTYHRRPIKALWEYIKAQISSVLGLTATSYGGNAATATALSAGSDRTKLDGIAAGAEVNVQSDWNQTTTTADDYIKNKPTIPSGTQLVYDCGTGSTSTTDFSNALAAYTAGKWVIINKDGVVYHCVGTYNSGLRFKTFANESGLLKVRTLTWTSGSAPTAETQLEASLTGHTHSQYLTSSDITGKMNTDGSNAAAQVNIIKDGEDVYVRVGEDSTKGIALSYDDSGSTPVMGIWTRWASGSGNGKYMCSCDTSGNCTFNGKATTSSKVAWSAGTASTERPVGFANSGNSSSYNQGLNFDSEIVYDKDFTYKPSGSGNGASSLTVTNPKSSSGNEAAVITKADVAASAIWLDSTATGGSHKRGLWAPASSVSGDSAQWILFNDYVNQRNYDGWVFIGTSERARYAYHDYYISGGSANWIKIGRVYSPASNASAGGALTAIISSGYNTSGGDLSAQLIRVSIRSKGTSTNGVYIVGDNVTLGLKSAVVGGDVRFAVHTVTARTTSVNGVYDIYVEEKGYHHVDVLVLHNDNVEMTYNSNTTKAISDTTNMTIFSPTLPYAGSSESAKELRIPYGSGSIYLQIGVSDTGNYLALGTNMADGVMVNYAAQASQAFVAGMLGTTSVGSANNPIYLNNGVPTACNWWVS